jgi:hypothetical protein
MTTEKKPTVPEARDTFEAAFIRHRQHNAPGDTEALFVALEAFIDAKIAAPGTTRASEEAAAKAEAEKAAKTPEPVA